MSVQPSWFFRGAIWYCYPLQFFPHKRQPYDITDLQNVVRRHYLGTLWTALHPLPQIEQGHGLLIRSRQNKPTHAGNLASFPVNWASQTAQANNENKLFPTLKTLYSNRYNIIHTHTVSECYNHTQISQPVNLKKVWTSKFWNSSLYRFIHKVNKIYWIATVEPNLLICSIVQWELVFNIILVKKGEREFYFISNADSVKSILACLYVQIGI